jgi:hypothetical protein
MQVSWIDAEEISALAESLRREPGVKTPPLAATPVAPALAQQPYALPEPAPVVFEPAPVVPEPKLPPMDLPVPAPVPGAPKTFAMSVPQPPPLPVEARLPAMSVPQPPPLPVESRVPEMDEPLPESVPMNVPTVDFRSRLQAIREHAIRAGLISKQQPSAEPVAPAPVTMAPVPAVPVPEIVQPNSLPAFDASAGFQSGRIYAFASWALRVLGQSELFVVGDQGNLLWGQPARSGMVLSAIMAWGATSRMSAFSAFETAAPLRQVLATGSHLIVIPCATRLGAMNIAIISAQPLPDMHVPTLRQALIGAMGAEG